MVMVLAPIKIDKHRGSIVIFSPSMSNMISDASDATSRRDNEEDTGSTPQRTKVYLREVTSAYWESGSFPADGILSGPPPGLSEPTMAMAVKNDWPIAFQQVNPQ